MQVIIDNHFTIILVGYCLYLVGTFYKEYFAINRNTDNVDLVARYVKLIERRKK